MKDEIEKFIKNHPIKTGGAISEYKITIKEIDDGDVYFSLSIPFWSNNDCVVDSVFDFLNTIRKESKLQPQRIFLRNGEFELHIFQSLEECCDPD